MHVREIGPEHSNPDLGMDGSDSQVNLFLYSIS
jgi:hypothetical protein